MIPFWLMEVCSRLASNDAELRNLNLNIRRLNTNMLQVLSEALEHNTVLRILNLTSSLIQPVLLDPLTRRIAPQLQILHLSYNQLHDIAPLAQTLQTNDSLQELYLDYNKIDGKGGVLLADALRYNSTLVILQLNSNQLYDEGALAFAHLLQNDNATLKTLCLAKNRVTSVGARALLQALETNTTLQVLDIKKNQVHSNIVMELEFWVETNRSGRYLLQREELPLGLWPYVLARVSQRPDMLYYFLTTKPGLCTTRR